MKISVIIPCLNSADTLGEQLEALARQRLSDPWEVIVADNGSTDASLEVAHAFKDHFPELVIIDAKEKRGASYARNRGVDVARSEFLAFCDADDLVGDGYLEAVVRALNRFQFVGCRYEYSRLNQRWISRIPGVQQNDVDCGMLGPIRYAGGGSLAVRKSVHELVGGFDETNFPFLQDTDYCVRIQREGIRLHFVPDAVVHYRWRETVSRAFAQARNWGRDVVALRLRYWPVELPVETPRTFRRNFRRLLKVRDAEELAYWIWATGWRFGTLEAWRAHLRETGVEIGASAWFREKLRHVAVGRVPDDPVRSGFAALGEASVLEQPARFDGREFISVGCGVRIQSGSWVAAVSPPGWPKLKPEIRIGDGSQIGRHCRLAAVRKLLIGKHVTIGNSACVSDNPEDCGPVAKPFNGQDLRSLDGIEVGDGCQIGDRSCVIGSVRMGEGSELGADSVLREDLPPFAFAAGNPAQVLKFYNSVSGRWEPAASGARSQVFPASDTEIPDAASPGY